MLVVILIILLIAVLSAGALFFVHTAKNAHRPLEIDDQEGHDFEYYCAELLRRDGFVQVEVTKGSGDFGADILAKKDGVTYAVQCKSYSESVGVSAVQEAAAGRDYYDRMVGAVMTNQYFTKPARQAAEKLKILLWDRDHIQDLSENY